MGVVEVVVALAGVAGALAGGEGGEGGLTGGLTGRADGLIGRADGETASGLTGRADLTGAAAGTLGALAEGVVELAGASGATAKGTATEGGLAPVGADGAPEVELLGNALPLIAAAAIGVAEEEGVEELLEELFEGAAVELDEGGMLARASERLLTAELRLSKSS